VGLVSRRRKENEKLPPAGRAGCRAHHGGAECGNGDAVLISVLYLSAPLSSTTALENLDFVTYFVT